MARPRILYLAGAVAALLFGILVIRACNDDETQPFFSEQGSSAPANKSGQPSGSGQEAEVSGGENEGEGGEGEGGEGETEKEGELIERQRYFYDQRFYPAKKPPAGALVRARRQADKLPEAKASQSRAAGEGEPTGLAGSIPFTSIGPKPITDGPQSSGNQWFGAAPRAGRITSIATHPTDANVAYIGAAQGGVWKTSDGGTSWAPLTDSEDSLAIGSVAVDPHDGNTVYAGTGDPDGSGAAYFGIGILKSTDGGQTWQRLGSTPFTYCYISDLIVHPGNSQTIVAAADSRVIGGSCATGIYKSTDGGQTWNKTSPGTCRPTTLAVNRQQPSVWYAGLTGCTTAGVYKSTDTAASWQPSSSGLPASAQVGRLKLAAAPSNGSRLYVIIAKSSGLPGIFTSPDGGASWSPVPADSDFCNVGSGSQCGYDLSLTVSKTDPATFYAGGIKIYQYTGSGTSHSVIGFSSTSGIHADQHVATVDASNRTWFGNDGGLYRTSDGGSTFQNLNQGLNITQFEPGNAGSLNTLFIAGTQDNGLLKYAGSESWQGFARIGDAGFSAVDPANSNYAYSTYPGAVVYRTTDGGATQMQSVFSPPAGDPSYFYAPLAIDQADARRVYIGTDRVWRSTSRGDSGTWSATSSTHFPGRVTTLGIPPGAPATLYATTPGTMQVSTNSGATWTDTAGNGLPNRWFTDFSIPGTASTAYVSASGFGAHVFKTTNTGANWTDISGDLPNSPASAIAVDPRTAPATIYVGTDVGVFAFTNGGTNWVNVADLPNAVVMDITIDLPNNKLVVTTFGRGAFTVPLLAGGGGGIGAPGTCHGKAPTITGTSAGEALTGTPYADVILAGAGDDDITGLEGNDTICGGPGEDLIAGGPGNDLIDGHDASSADDGLYDALDYTASAQGVVVRLAATEGGQGTVTGEGQDTVFRVSDVIGSSKADDIQGSDTSNWIQGLGGNDRLVGRGGTDFLRGADNDDTFAGGAGDDIFDGGAGYNLADYTSATGPLKFDLVAGRETGGAAEGSDYLIGITDVYGTSAGDTFVGGVADDLFIGRAGDDILTGAGGSDDLRGEDGADTINAQDGVTDQVSCGTGADPAPAVDPIDSVSCGQASGAPPAAQPPAGQPSRCGKIKNKKKRKKCLKAGRR